MMAERQEVDWGRKWGEGGLFGVLRSLEQWAVAGCRICSLVRWETLWMEGGGLGCGNCTVDADAVLTGSYDVGGCGRGFGGAGGFASGVSVLEILERLREQ